jgi:hypothetical protein
MNKEQKIITWKDADDAACHAAALMLQEASLALRASYDAPGSHRTDDGKGASPGMGEENSKRTWWTYGWVGADGNVAIDDGEFDILNLDSAQAADPPIDRICWWSFQNLIRLRLKEARQEIHDALFAQGTRLRESDQRSRNARKRRRGSKFNWSTNE